jgi:sec-independent protein translocase protein TatA
MYGRIGELVLILVLFFLLFGAGKLPGIMKDIGRSIKMLRSGLHGDEKETKAIEEKVTVDNKTNKK